MRLIINTYMPIKIGYYDGTPLYVTSVVWNYEYRLYSNWFGTGPPFPRGRNPPGLQPATPGPGVPGPQNEELQEW